MSAPRRGERVQIRVDAELLAEFDRAWSAYGLETRSEAVREAMAWTITRWCSWVQRRDALAARRDDAARADRLDLARIRRSHPERFDR